MRKISHWLECYMPGESLDLLRDFSLSHALEGGAVGAQIGKLVRAGDFRALCEFNLDYTADLTVAQFAACRQALAFFSKLEHLDIGIDKELVAFTKFQETEALCRETNLAFSSWARGEFRFSGRVEAVLFAAQRKIAHVLGDVPKLSKLRYRFGPGATTLTKKRDASARRKLHDGIACSKDLVLSAGKLLEEMPSWADLHDSGVSHQVDWVDVSETACAVRFDTAPGRSSAPVQIMEGVLGFVAKNAKTYRAIVTEPPLNGVLQLALGDHIAKRLAKFGVDLSDQTPNQRYAKEGSLTGALATLDLSSASDTVATELVHHLLPVDWAIALSAGRTSAVTYKGQTIELEKFSSMGNGFTFALESLIFWALARSCSEKDDVVSIYGDDIIVAAHNVPLLTEVLTACGFILNKEKSFSTGPFRESCGADYYRGFDIRPYYQKSWVSPADLFKLHNFYVRHGDEEKAASVRKHIAPNLVLYGPDGYGDGHLIGEHPRERKLRHLRSGWAGYVFDTFKHGTKREKSRPIPGDYVFALYSIYQRDVESIGIDAGESLRAHDYASCFGALKHLRYGHIVGTPIPEWTTHEGETVKSASLPGTEGYKRISIYTLGA